MPSCPNNCPCVFKAPKKKNNHVKFRLVQYGKKRRVKKNQCPPKLKCQKEHCQSYASCSTQRCRRALGLAQTCIHVPDYGGKNCCN